MPRRRTTARRLSRKDWLEHALEALSKKGQSGLSIQDLSAALGVSRGSFYWHFKDRNDFIHALLKYWYEEYTVVAPIAVELEGGTAEERLLRLMRLVHDQDLMHYDLIIRALATSDRQFERWVKKADRFRLKYVRKLFIELGFANNTLRIRARSCLAYMTLEHELFDNLDRKHRSDLVDNLHKFLIRK